MVLEYFPVSRILLVLEAWNKNFLEQLFFIKNIIIKKSLNLAKLLLKISPSIELIVGL